ncbi:TRAP transporter substrate-binding protein DctP [Bacillus dakarensis]|uniref:TRAP transporter substrate-binding protein DctP n=1 Tax=Robertmurraya dakarensis TaxID=1926278 RepID=UPI000980AE7E|nr:TRAP transporter substrate-binding protein DctP [Bacillus dakarensis]
MKQRFLYLLSIISILTLFIAGCSSSSNQSSGSSGSTGDQNDNSEEEVEKIKLKFASYFAGTSPIYTAVTEPFMKRVTELTDGKVEFEYYPSEQLGKAGDLLQLTSDGVADLAIFPTNYTPDLMPITNMLSGLPGLSTNADQGTKAYNQLIKQNTQIIELEYKKNGIKPLLMHVSPNYEIWTKDLELRVPADLEGKKIRTPGGVANELYEYMGAIPVAIPFPEIYEGLDKGVIEAIALYGLGLKNGGIDEITNYVVMPHIATAIQGIMINQKVWDGLPEDVQKAMIQASDEIIETAGAVYAEETIKFDEDFVANGGTIAELTQEEMAQWNKVSEEFVEKWLTDHADEGYPYQEILAEYKELLKEFE